MNLRIKNFASFIAWLDEQTFQYAVLWEHDPQTGTSPRGVPKRHCLLVEDRAVESVARGGPWAGKWSGQPCEIYSVNAGCGADFVGHSFLPAPLASAVLQNRVRRQDGVAVPRDRDLYYALLFHLAYHQAEESGIEALDGSSFLMSPWHARLEPLAARLGQPSELSLLDMHHALAEQGYAIDPARLSSYLQRNFKRRFKSRLYGLALATEKQGEVNLFVLRAHVVRRGFRQVLLDEIAKHYTILAVKDIPWLTRFKNARHMRGNKWRWGGWPVVAVVVFDPAPLWRPAEERTKEHTHVFNRRQFFKRELRERIIRDGQLHHKQNAMHTTDNEAEAIGHLDLFFSPEEEREIHARAQALREGLGETTAPLDLSC